VTLCSGGLRTVAMGFYLSPFSDSQSIISQSADYSCVTYKLNTGR
jgi:hypothetical protein